MIVTMGMAVEGRPVKEYPAWARSQAIMGVALGKDIRAWGRGIVGGRSADYEAEVKKAVSEAMTELRVCGNVAGADALIAVAISYESVGNKTPTVAASGTAVKLAKPGDSHRRSRRSSSPARPWSWVFAACSET